MNLSYQSTVLLRMAHQEIFSGSHNLVSDAERVYFDSRVDHYFTRREAQCVYYLIYLKYRWKVAELLGLSRRTIDAYTETAKRKAGCSTQKELIEYAIRIKFPRRMRCEYEDWLIEPVD